MPALSNPVGRLVLRIAGYRDEQLDRSSDALCTALQLTNFWQDLGRDWRKRPSRIPGGHDARRGRERRDAGRRAAHGCVGAGGCGLRQCDPQRFAAGRLVCDGVRGGCARSCGRTWLRHAHSERVEHDATSCCIGVRRSARATRQTIVWRALAWRS